MTESSLGMPNVHRDQDLDDLTLNPTRISALFPSPTQRPERHAEQFPAEILTVPDQLATYPGQQQQEQQQQQQQQTPPLLLGSRYRDDEDASLDPSALGQNPEIIISEFARDPDAACPEHYGSTLEEEPSASLSSYTSYIGLGNGSLYTHRASVSYPVSHVPARTPSYASSHISEETASVSESLSSMGDAVRHDVVTNRPSCLASPVASFPDHKPHSVAGPQTAGYIVPLPPSYSPSDSKCPWLRIQPASATETTVGTGLCVESHLFHPDHGANHAHSQPTPTPTPILSRPMIPRSVPQTSTLSSMLTWELSLNTDGGGVRTGRSEAPIPPTSPARELSGGPNSPAWRSFDQHQQFYSQPASPTVSMAPPLMARNWSTQSHPTVLSSETGAPNNGWSSNRRTHSTGTKSIPITSRRPRPQRASHPRSSPVFTCPFSDGRLSKHERGRRTGPMPPDRRAAARRTRQSKSICIRCKLSRQSCQPTDDVPDAPCENCRKLSVTSKWPGPCIRAYFDDIVLAGALDTMAQRIVYHVTPDGRRPMRLKLCEDFDLDDLLGVLDDARGQFNVRVKQGDQSVYVLNLDECFAYLSRVRTELRSSGYDHNLRRFLDQELLRGEPKRHDWGELVLDCGLQTDKLRLLYVLGQMTSHATFYYVYKTQCDPNGALLERMMDAASLAEAAYVILAAYLVRIVNRKAEVDGFAYLQNQLHSSYLRQTSVSDLVTLHAGLGRILTGLRWRVSCCGLLAGSDGAAGNSSPGGSSAGDKADALADPGRAMEMCRVLYFYFYGVWRRILYIGSADDRNELVDGVWVQYAEAAKAVWDAFPGVDGESFPGFRAWMEQGRQLVLWSGAAQRLLGGLS